MKINHTWGSRCITSQAPAAPSVSWCDGSGGGDDDVATWQRGNMATWQRSWYVDVFNVVMAIIIGYRYLVCNC